MLPTASERLDDERRGTLGSCQNEAGRRRWRSGVLGDGALSSRFLLLGRCWPTTSCVVRGVGTSFERQQVTASFTSRVASVLFVTSFGEPRDLLSTLLNAIDTGL